MNKSQLTDKLAIELGHHQMLAKNAVDLFFNSIKKALEEGDKVEIRGFGAFHLKEYDGYTGRNPKTGKQVQVRPKRLPVFKIGKDLKERVNKSITPTPQE